MENSNQPKRAQLKIEDVTRVYSGKNGKCCCGCSGKYFEKGERGSAKMIQKVVDMINNDDAEPCGYYEVVKGDRLYLAYTD